MIGGKLGDRVTGDPVGEVVIGERDGFWFVGSSVGALVGTLIPVGS